MMDAKNIKEHMEVLGADGKRVGTVDALEGADKIVLTKSDPMANGQHHLIPVGWVDHVDAQVHLNKPAKDVMAQWQTAA